MRTKQHTRTTARWNPFFKKHRRLHKRPFHISSNKDKVAGGHGMIAPTDIAKGKSILTGVPLVVTDNNLGSSDDSMPLRNT